MNSLSAQRSNNWRRSCISALTVLMMVYLCGKAVGEEMSSSDSEFSFELSTSDLRAPTKMPTSQFSFSFFSLSGDIGIAPTVMPSASPTTVAPTAMPTEMPTEMPSTAAPTFMPTMAPTFAPTASPTRRPTRSPTTAQPSFQPTSFPTPEEFIAFSSSLGIGGLPDLDLDNEERGAIASSVCEVMELPRSDCEFVSFTPDNDTRRALAEDSSSNAGGLRGWQDQVMDQIPRFLQQTFSITAIVRTIVNLGTFTGNSQNLQNDLEQRLVTAVNDGQLTQTLQTIAAEFNITDLLNANVTGVSIVSDTPVGDDESGGGGGGGSDSDGGLSDGEVAALVICLVLAAVLLIVGIYFLNRYYLQKRGAEADAYRGNDLDAEPLMVSSGGGVNHNLAPGEEDLRPTEKSGALIQSEPEDQGVIPL